MTTFIKSFSPSFPAFAHQILNDFEHKAKVNSFTLPAINVIDNEADITLQLAAPGLKKEDFNIKIHEQTLTISATKKAEETTLIQNFSRKEFDFSTFKRAFSIPKSINVENVEAVYQDGILNIVLAKLEEAKPKEPKAINVL